MKYSVGGMPGMPKSHVLEFGGLAKAVPCIRAAPASDQRALGEPEAAGSGEKMA